MLTKIKILRRHGKQYIRDLSTAELPESYHGGVPVIFPEAAVHAAELELLCPAGAICSVPFSIDLGRCVFCNECSLQYPGAVKFSTDYRVASNKREGLVVDGCGTAKPLFDPEQVRSEITRIFGRALKLRVVCAGGDGSTEMELNASMNVNFDFTRYGVEFVASPRHADGIVITGPITENMAVPLELCYNAIAEPKIVILAGTDAISGGLFAGEGALNRSFMERFPADLYIPGNPVHPLSFIHGVMQLIGQKF